MTDAPIFDGSPDPPSDRERQIAGAFAEGETYSEIAGRLNLAPSTVSTHLATIYRKLGVSSKLDLRKRIEAAPPADPVVDHPPRPDKPSIAVLAFENMSGDPQQEYFSGGITEDIVTALSRSPWLFVIARNSSPVRRISAQGCFEPGLRATSASDRLDSERRRLVGHHGSGRAPAGAGSRTSNRPKAMCMPSRSALRWVAVPKAVSVTAQVHPAARVPQPVLHQGLLALSAPVVPARVGVSEPGDALAKKLLAIAAGRPPASAR